MDRDAVLWLAEQRVHQLDPLAVALGYAGFAGLVWIVLAPLVARRAGVAVVPAVLATAASVWAADLVALGVKALVQRPRPFETIPGVEALIGATVGTSFPSGHAATSAAGALVLAAILRRAAPVVAVLALAIAGSRVYAGVHYPTDILAGVAVGCAAGAAAIALRARPRLSGSPPRRPGGPRAG